jgi:hypothetical protein
MIRYNEMNGTLSRPLPLLFSLIPRPDLPPRLIPLPRPLTIIGWSMPKHRIKACKRLSEQNTSILVI